jgi:glucose-6-phosphate-specific signal transduction histidine kinase
MGASLMNLSVWVQELLKKEAKETVGDMLMVLMIMVVLWERGWQSEVSSSGWGSWRDWKFETKM